MPKTWALGMNGRPHLFWQNVQIEQIRQVGPPVLQAAPRMQLGLPGGIHLGFVVDCGTAENCG